MLTCNASMSCACINTCAFSGINTFLMHNKIIAYYNFSCSIIEHVTTVKE